MKVDIRQVGKFEALDMNGGLISQHSTYRVALEVVINAGGGSVKPYDRIVVEIDDMSIPEPVEDTIAPATPSIIKITES